MYKNQLQELAQRSCFNLPSYSCIREGPDHAPRFKAIVNFNGESFESPTFCSNLRLAEHAAAEMALNTLASRGPSRALAARVLDETGVYKNLLQETAHRAGLKLPVYTTFGSGPGHIPVFSCTVELAGMTFTGELARTKKQAQKNAAMVAWSTLKRLVQDGSSSSSLSSSSADAKNGSEEQEQATVARFLASLRPSQLNNSKQNNYQLGQERFLPVYKGLTCPNPSVYSTQCQSWAYPSFSSEMEIYEMWQQEHWLRLQNHLLALHVPPAPLPGPQILPFMQSVMPPESPLFVPVREQEPMTVGSRITIATSGPSLYISDRLESDPTRGKSTVTIQEIHEEKAEESSEFSSSFVPDPPLLGTFSPGARLKEPVHEDKKQKDRDVERKVQNVQLEENQFGQFECGPSRRLDSGYKPVDSPVQTLHGFDAAQSIQYPARPISPRYFGPPSSVIHPVSVRTVASVPSSSGPSGSSRNMGPVTSTSRTHDSVLRSPVSPRMRTGVQMNSARPQPQRMRPGGVHARFMAPAVRIRSVVPVCSAPPASKIPMTSGQEVSLLNREKDDTKPEDVSTASSELGYLRI